MRGGECERVREGGEGDSDRTITMKHHRWFRTSLAIARPTYFPQHRMYCITGTREGKVWCNALHPNLNSAEFLRTRSASCAPVRTESDWLTDYCYVTDTANNFPRSQPEATPLELYSAQIPWRYPWRYRGPTLRSRALFG